MTYFFSNKMNSVSNEAMFTICRRVLGINFVIAVHHNSTQASTSICATSQVVSHCLSPRSPGFNPRRFIVLETVTLGQ